MPAATRISFWASRGGARTIGALAALIASSLCDAAAPALQQSEFSTVLAGSCRLDASAGEKQVGNSRTIIASAFARRALAVKGWYLVGGIQAENYFFSNGPAWPRRLQDYAAIVGVEYYVGEENVASLTFRPGWYLETHPGAAAWDIPVDFTTGIPIIPGLNGVVGFSNARFYRHALPVFGLIWTLGSRVRIEAVYPEPALVFTINRAASLRVGGELTGAGFLSDERSGRTAIEYVSYRVGAELRGTWRPGKKFGVGAGVETERNLDFFRLGQRLHHRGVGYLKFSLTFP